MAAPAAAPNGGDHLPPVPEDETITNMANMNRYKLKPPFFNGDYGTFEEWKYKFTAYLEPLLGTLWTLDTEPSLGTLEPSEPSLGTFTWNFLDT